MGQSDDEFGFFRRRAVPPPSTSLIAFYDGTGADGRGRTLEQILGWGAGQLEQSHDYIQTLFPLPEASGVNDSAPIINTQVFQAFRQRPELRGRLRDAFVKMLWFYGFELVDEEDTLSVRPASNFRRHSQHWNTRFDHNHLRITRIIRCLRLLGLEKEAQAFYDTISCATGVSARSRMYWDRAMHRPLNIAPDVDDHDGEVRQDATGPKFLRDFQEEKIHLETQLLDSKEEAKNQSTPEAKGIPGTLIAGSAPKEKVASTNSTA